MNAVLKIHILMLLTLGLPLQTLHGMDQVKQLTSNKSFLIFGAGTASVLLAYTGYKAWRYQTPEQAIEKIKTTINEDLTTLIELLWIFDNPDRYAQLYDTNSAVYSIFNNFLNKYTSWKTVIFSPNKSILNSADFLKRKLIGDPIIDKVTESKNQTVNELKKNITAMTELITQIINTQMHRGIFTRIVQAFSKPYANKIDPKIMNIFIERIIILAQSINANLNILAESHKRKDEPPADTIETLASFNLSELLKESTARKTSLISLIAGKLPTINKGLEKKLETKEKALKEIAEKPTFIEIFIETLGTKLNALRNYIAQTTKRAATIGSHAATIGSTKLNELRRYYTDKRRESAAQPTGSVGSAINFERNPEF